MQDHEKNLLTLKETCLTECDFSFIREVIQRMANKNLVTDGSPTIVFLFDNGVVGEEIYRLFKYVSGNPMCAMLVLTNPEKLEQFKKS